ncbi:MAG: SH3 domain-containing protein [Phenylobacterium sp.]|uniref:SH3 domain-containing protein n=1 Tax=Phenylobacterium sp. TaxID=1871053 RepID=UPI00391C15E5
MRTQKTSKLMRGAAATALAGALAVGAVSTASAQTYGRGPTGLEPVVGCDAPGNKQVGGALIGALLGAAAGSNLAKNDRGTGTAIGAVAGAAAGSYVGCRMQRADTQRGAYYGGGYQAAPATYTHGGVTLDSAIAPASFHRDGGTFVATTSVNLRGAPTTNSARVGALRPGERFQGLARVRGTEWILVGQNGVGVGYVHDAYVRPAGYQYANYGY